MAQRYDLFFIFVDLQKALARVPRVVFMMSPREMRFKRVVG